MSESGGEKGPEKGPSPEQKQRAKFKASRKAKRKTDMDDVIRIMQKETFSTVRLIPFLIGTFFVSLVVLWIATDVPKRK